MIQSSMGFKDVKTSPLLYFRSTDEMIAEFFSYLDEEIVNKIVIENPKLISDKISLISSLFPDGSFPPMIASAEEDVKRLTLLLRQEDITILIMMKLKRKKTII